MDLRCVRGDIGESAGRVGIAVKKIAEKSKKGDENFLSGTKVPATLHMAGTLPFQIFTVSPTPLPL
jgi:hypothetical protein